jgi:hypothetical protein
MKMIKEMNPSRICIIALLALISAYVLETRARGWTYIGNCPMQEKAQRYKDVYAHYKNKYDNLDRSKLPPDVDNSLSSQWQNLTGEHNILLQKLMDFGNYCAKLKAKGDSTAADVSKFNSACGEKDWDLPAYSHCESWRARVLAEINERESEYAAFHKQWDPFLEREKRLSVGFQEFAKTLDRARCDAVQQEYASYKRSFETWENKKKPLQEKINILRKKIAETVEFPSNDYSSQDLAECEALAYSMIGRGGGVPCRIWNEGDWYEKNPILGNYKVEKYYLEAELAKIDREAKRVMREWQGKYINYRFQEKLQCPGLEKLEKLY